MERKTKMIAGAVFALAVVGAGAGVAVAGDSNDDDTPITGAALDSASDAALEHTGEGTVTDSEVGDEEGFYEVEVTLDDGSQVDVHLDEDFNVLGADADVEEGGDD